MSGTNEHEQEAVQSTDATTSTITQEKSESTAMDQNNTVHDASQNETGESANPQASSPDSGSQSEGNPPVDEKAQIQQEQQKTNEERRGWKVVVIMFALGIAVFLAAIDVTIVTTALPTIAEYFHSSSGYTWIGSAYLLGAATATPIWGKFSDVFGRKPVLMLANFGFLIGSLVAALAINIGMLIVGRAIQGISGGGLITLVNICIGDLFSQRRRGAYYGIIGGVWALASSLGPILGGAFTEDVTWRWCFYINLPFDGLALVIIFFFLDLKTPRTPVLAGLKAIDWLGSLLIVGGTLMFLFGLQYGGVTYPWNSATVICLIVFGVITVILFFLWEWKGAKYPVIPLRIFKYRSNVAVLAVCFIHGLVFIAGSYYIPLFFQACLGATPLLSGVYILAQSVSLSVTSMATGIFIRKTGQYMPPILLGLFFMTVGYGLYIDLDAESSWAKIFLYQIVAGIGIGPNFQAPLIALQTLVSRGDIASATATFGFTRMLASSTSVVIGQVVYQNQLSTPSHIAKLRQAIHNPHVASALSGGEAGASTQIIDKLPKHAKYVARNVFADSLMPMWIMYTCFAVVGFAVAFLITRQGLKKEHEETKTGLEAEEANRQEALRNKDLRKQNAEEFKREQKDQEGSNSGNPNKEDV